MSPSKQRNSLHLIWRIQNLQDFIDSTTLHLLTDNGNKKRVIYLRKYVVSLFNQYSIVISLMC
jgi:hypothetical protein